MIGGREARMTQRSEYDTLEMQFSVNTPKIRVCCCSEFCTRYPVNVQNGDFNRDRP